ncbi:hypothetical protein [Hymenobacter sp. B1770]|uniref:hypothetical protein n=1 Tax=Hymenobacter sp. B1770 TaxID=1718788 RepID=UPI003CF40A1F
MIHSEIEIMGLYPTPNEVEAFKNETMLAYLLNRYYDDVPELKKQLLQLAGQLLAEGWLVETWNALLLL